MLHISLLQDQISLLNPLLPKLYAFGPHSPTLLMSRSKSKGCFFFLPDHYIHFHVLYHHGNNKLALIYCLTNSENLCAFLLQSSMSLTGGKMY